MMNIINQVLSVFCNNLGKLNEEGFYCEKETTHKGVTFGKPHLIEAYFIVLGFALLCFTDVFFTDWRQDSFSSRKIITHFIAVVWNQTLNISKICLYLT